MQEFGFPTELNLLLLKIEDKTHNYKNKNGETIKDILLKYCTKEDFVKRYDGMFWSNEGFNWEYNQNGEVVKLIDDFFINYREEFYPCLPMLSYDASHGYNTRLSYIDRNIK